MKRSKDSPTRRRPATSRLLLVALFGLVLSSCTMRALVGVDVNEDGSGVFEVTMAFDEELRTLLEEDATEPVDWTDPSSFEGENSPAHLVDEFPEGASISPYTEDDYEGFTVTVEFSSLEELDEMLSETSSEGEEAFPFEITENGEGRFELTTHADMFGEVQPSDDDLEMFSPSMLGELFDIQLHVQLPGQVVSTNADETSEDGVMVWRLNPMAEEQIRPEAVSQVSSSSSAALLVVIALLVIGAVAAVVVFLRRTPTAQPEPVTVGAVVTETSEEPA